MLEGKVAPVTGAGSGIGRAITLEMGRAGAAVIVNDVGAAHRRYGDAGLRLPRHRRQHRRHSARRDVSLDDAGAMAVGGRLASQR